MPDPFEDAGGTEVSQTRALAWRSSPSDTDMKETVSKRRQGCVAREERT